MSVQLLVGNKKISVEKLLICPVKGVPLDRGNTSRAVNITRRSGNNVKTLTAYVDSKVTDDEFG